MSDLINNVERSMFTFNLNNITNICFKKSINFENMKNNNNTLSDEEKARFDNCIDKYLLAFNIVKEETQSHIENFFKNN
jgi:hypothetical protein